MTQISSDNKRIAKNTLMLYIRMFFIMLVSLYATRVVLHALGEENYGIYNVVGGIVVMFSFLSRVLASASQRFFAFEMGRGNKVRLKQIFSITQVLYVLIIIVIIIAAESLGLWFLHSKATIPAERMGAANWIFQFSVVSFSLSLFTTPYQAAIIAHEKMDVYAVVGIIEALLNLIVALALQYIPFSNDILIMYGLFVMLNGFIVSGVYIVYSLKRYEESHFKYYWDSSLAKEILSYSGWNLFGAVAGVARSQGINMLINVFFNPAVNAARGIAYQINSAINQFAHNFYTAVRPQVTKNYAKGDMDATLSLVFSSSKLTYYLLLFVAVPIMVYAEPILQKWLVEVPAHTLMFTELVIIVALIDSISNPLMTLAQATGKIALYQAVVGTLLLLNLPISYVFLKLGYQAEVTMVVAVFIAAVSLIARLVILRGLVSFPVRKYCVQVLFKITIPTILSFGLVYLLRIGVFPEVNTVVVLLLKLAVAVMLTVLAIFLTGLTKKEKDMMTGFFKRKFKPSSK